MTGRLTIEPACLASSSEARPKVGLRIPICSGFGTGPTKLAAFDAALREVGIANFNLVQLSSVIPPGSELREAQLVADEQERLGDWGDRLYVVMADERVDVPGREAWAGIGWLQGSGGKGLFVEHHGASEEQVRHDIEASLGSLAGGRDEQFSPPRMSVRGGTCRDEPVCALVAAVYQSEGWTLPAS